jgi:CRP/FNR family transcriptional regulator, cyclic AMP receptor protein
MIVKGCPLIAQLKQVSIFQDLELTELKNLVSYSYVREYQPNEIIMHEDDFIRGCCL